MDLQQISRSITSDINVNSIFNGQDVISPDIMIGSPVYKWIIDYTIMCINSLNGNKDPLDVNDLDIMLNSDNDKLVEPHTYGKMTTNNTIREVILSNTYELYQKYIDFTRAAYDLNFRYNGIINQVLTVYVDSKLLYYQGQSFRDPRWLPVTWNVTKALDKVKYGGSIIRLKMRWNQLSNILSIGYPFKYQINTSIPLPLDNEYEMVLLPGKFVINDVKTRVKYYNSYINVYDAEYQQLDFSQYLTYTSDALNIYQEPTIFNIPSNYMHNNIIKTINHNIKSLLPKSSSVASKNIKAGWLYRFHSNIDANISKSWNIITDLSNGVTIDKDALYDDELNIDDVFNISSSTFGNVGNTHSDEYVIVYVSETVMISTKMLYHVKLKSYRPDYIIPCTTYASDTINGQYNTPIRVRIDSLSLNLHTRYENGNLIYEQKHPLYVLKPNYYKLSKKTGFKISKYSVNAHATYNAAEDIFRYLNNNLES